ncbi:urea carboxylase [Telmatospirillum sp.]|uniref:urea carboxylase n=1 Tax=Telmatospirillum sp. TaxID=2079197 RepID=UPI002849AE62|nr:urea carboxylase [Telmatospirillum sp.]MDR3436750.1 urea carboxylase [Telmatospirillum sp.]
MFGKVLVANRGAIACRIIRTLDRMGIASVAVYSEADRHSLHVSMAGEAICVGPAPAAQSYLKTDAILEAARRVGADAIHPGYGFLSENADFAEACGRAGLVFIGPQPENIRAFGLKHRARALAAAAGVPLAPGSGLLADVGEALREADRIGYPVMLKSTAGGGGIGLQLCRSAAEMAPLFERVKRLAGNNFKDNGVFLEKYVERGRHIEVQIFGDGRGAVIALGERDCSSQRRNQKVVEETPAPGLSAGQRHDLCQTAVRLGQAVAYANAGTVEFILDADRGEFYFLEVNTRLQVEHGITEEVTGVDLVEWMIRQAAGAPLPLADHAERAAGASIEVRLYAEDPGRAFRPSSGLLTAVRWPDGVRVETWVESGSEISPFYDPMLAKLIVTGRDRPDAVEKMRQALAATEVAGIESNLRYLRALVDSPAFVGGTMTTRTLESFPYHPRSIEVLTAGTQTTLQDYPGRIGYWDVGVPPSGPMDSLSFRLANCALGNDPGTVALEITISGPSLQFNTDATICLSGAAMAATLDGRPIPFWRPVSVRAGQTLAMGTISETGCRSYLAVQGGFDVPDYLGSKATFTLGKFGGHGGRTLKIGDVLHLGRPFDGQQASPVPADIIPVLDHHWTIGVLYGPHGAPDFFTDDDMAEFFAADWEVHYNSNRTGVRLIGPRPKWARSDGGEAGLHPSNIHDNAYAVGAVDFTGDMPVILGPDGPSLGGFVCPVTIVQAELWKIGQLRPGDRVRFRRLSPEAAVGQAVRQQAEIAAFERIDPALSATVSGAGIDDAVVGRLLTEAGRPEVVYRRAGDCYLLVEYGPPVLDLELRFRVHALMTWLKANGPAGIIELTPGIRSLQLHYDNRLLPLDDLLAILRRAEQSIPAGDDLEVPTRIVYLPLSWDDAATRKAIDKYMQSVRADAPWCPSNIEFIRRINGLKDISEVKKIVFEASYLVLGLGDVYLGAPVATPIDPRHRLVTTKYNPARTWTPENAVGIGGAYLCVYGMEGPGGYQFVGRTCQMWNAHKSTAEFAPGTPWLLRFFDQLRFIEVSAEELLAFREDFPRGKAHLRIEETTTFRLSDYRRFLAENDTGIKAFKAHQQQAFEEERARWEASGQIGYGAELPEVTEDDGNETLPPGGIAVPSPVPGSIWKIAVEAGRRVKTGDVLMIVESMKTEISVTSPTDGLVVELRCSEGHSVTLGQTVMVMVADEREAA